MRAATWNRSIIGVSDNTFPHPDDWSLGGCSLPLPKISVKTLTQLFSPASKPSPNCWKALQDRFPKLSNAPHIGLLYSDTLLGPADYYNHFKFITRRALARIIAMDRSAPCPICVGPRNHTGHYINCRPIKSLWIRLASLLELPPLTAPQSDSKIRCTARLNGPPQG